MALEKWLCDELDQGRCIDRWIERILAEGESLALVGVLLDIGKRAVQMFQLPLRELLTGWELYYWDHSAVMQRSHMSPGMFGWWRQPGPLQQIAREWYTACTSTVRTPGDCTPVAHSGRGNAEVLRGKSRLVGSHA